MIPNMFPFIFHCLIHLAISFIESGPLELLIKCIVIVVIRVKELDSLHISNTK